MREEARKRSGDSTKALHELEKKSEAQRVIAQALQEEKERLEAEVYSLKSELAEKETLVKTCRELGQQLAQTQAELQKAQVESRQARGCAGSVGEGLARLDTIQKDIILDAQAMRAMFHGNNVNGRLQNIAGAASLSLSMINGMMETLSQSGAEPRTPPFYHASAPDDGREKRLYANAGVPPSKR